MKKSLSLLLAIALVFGMFYSVAAAATPTPAEAGQQLKDYGVIQGSNGDLMEDSTWLRQDIAVLLSRLLGVEAAAKATAKTHTFKDVKGTFYDGYLSWAKEEGYIIGHSATKFGFGDELTNQQFAAIVLRVFGIDDYDNAVEKAIGYGILPAGAKATEPAKRGDTFVGIVAALNTEVPGLGITLGAHLKLPGFPTAVAAAISSAKATGAKKITVEFNGAIDTAKAKFSVLNGTNVVNYKSATPSADKKSVVIEFALNLPAADYTVKVEGLTEAALTATVKVEAEKVAKIEFLSDKAALNRGDNTIVSVGYKVLNQYGEEINSTALSATAGKGAATAASGTLNIDAATPFVLGEKVVVSLVHTSGAFATATLEVAAPAAVASVDIVELYQADKKELVAGTTDPFYLVLDLKDQYGASVTGLTYLNDGSDLIVTVSNPSAASLVGYTNNNATFSILNNKVVLQLAGGTTAGTSTVTLISKTNGAKDSFDISVKANVKVDTLTLTAPASAPAGETVEIPFTAVDQFGAAIANPTNSQVNSISVTNGTYLGFVKDHVKNTTSFKVTLGAKGTSIVTVITGTNKVAQISINVTDAKVATMISGIKNADTSFLVGGSTTLANGNVVVKDQYGNDFTPVYGTGLNQYRVLVETSDSSKVGLTGTYVNDTSSVTLTAAAKGSSAITLTLEQNLAAGWTKVANSSYIVNTKVVDKADIKTYTASVAGTVYTLGGSDYYKDLTVKGTLEDGSTVSVPNSTYNYAVNTAGSGVSYTGSKINGSGFVFSGSDTSAETSVVVSVYGANGQEILPVTVKVSKVAPAVTTLELVSNGVATKEADGVVSVTAANINGGITTLLNNAIKAVDQYGIEWTAGTEPAYTVYTGNFPSGKTMLSQLVGGDSISVTAVTPNGKYISFKVIVK